MLDKDFGDLDRPIGPQAETAVAVIVAAMVSGARAARR
jgi:hypothetical protein